MQRVLRSTGVAVCLAFLAGCVSAPSGDQAIVAAPEPTRQVTSIDILNDPGSWQGRAVFVGVAQRRRDRDQEPAIAVRHAAEQASRFTGLSASYRVVAQSAGSDQFVVDRISTIWDEALPEALIERAEVLEVVSTDQATYVRVTFDRLAAPPLGRIDTELDRSGVPRWVLQPPVIDGYVVGVGITLRGSTVRRSVDRADENALQDIVQQVETSVRLVQADRDTGRTGTRNLTTTALSSEAELAEFYVIARYADTDSRYYYSLALARGR